MQVHLASETVSWADSGFKRKLRVSLSYSYELLLILRLLSLQHSLKIYQLLSLLSKISLLLKQKLVNGHIR